MDARRPAFGTASASGIAAIALAVVAARAGSADAKSASAATTRSEIVRQLPEAMSRPRKETLATAAAFGIASFAPLGR